LGDKVEVEFIVVNDGDANEKLSSLFNVVQQAYPHARLIGYNKNRGKGFALRTGVAAALAPHIITTDLDFPYEIEDVKRIFLF
jgi:glycosyltransferase involved in cell wall biosynthesis